MPKYYYEAMDATGQEIKDSIDVVDEATAQQTIRQMGYFVTRISLDKPEYRAKMVEFPLARFSVLDMMRELLYRFLMFFYLMLPKRKCSCCNGDCK